uniref:Tetraspanin n=1 Tax=Scylla olivacea TaxID=85551 RepID=A0A0P4W6U4_SCYOL
MGVCCYTFLKYISVVWNLLFMVMGGAWLGLVLWVYFSVTDIAVLTSDVQGYKSVLYFLMVVGAIVFILGFLGCCGACQESQCMLGTFFALVLVLFTGQIAIGVWAHANKDKFTKVFTDAVTSTIKTDYGTVEIKTNAFNTIQENLKCCGSQGPDDWAGSNFNNAEEGHKEIGVAASRGYYKVPFSCCVVPGCDNKLNMNETPNPDIIYVEGCSEKILNVVQPYSNEILYCLLAILLIQVLAMILSMVLCCTVRRIDHVKA